MHAYTKLLDDFPNKVRKELHEFSSTLLDPKHLEEVSNFIAPNIFSNNIDSWIEDHTIELLLKCQEFSITNDIDKTLKSTSITFRDSIRETHNSKKLHGSNESSDNEIDLLIDLSEDLVLTNPINSNPTPLKSTIQPNPNPKNPNTNPNPKYPKNPNPNPKNPKPINQNPNPKNPNPNPNPKNLTLIPTLKI